MISLTIGITIFRDQKNYKLRTKFIKKAIKSILSQKFSKNIFVIIGNDNPDYPFHLSQIGIRSNKNIKIINRKKNLGEEKNMNDLLVKAKTKWFMWLADDDYLHKDFFKTINELKNINDCAAIYTNYYRLYENKKIKKKKINPEIMKINLSDFHNLFLSRKMNLIGVYGVIKKKLLIKIKGIKTLGDSYGPYSDTLIPLKLSRFGKIGYINSKLVYFRIHNDSLSINNDYPAYYSAKSDFLKNYKNLKKYLPLNEYLTNIFHYNNWFINSIYEVLQRDNERSLIYKIIIIGNLKRNLFAGYNLKFNFIIILKIFRYILKIIFK